MKRFLYWSFFWGNVIIFCFVPLGIPILLLLEGVPLAAVTCFAFLLKTFGVRKPWRAYILFLRRFVRDAKAEIERMSQTHPVVTRIAAAISFISLTVMVLLMTLAFFYAG